MHSKIDKIELTFPNGQLRSFPAGIFAEKIAKEIGNGLAKNAVAAQINEHIIGLRDPINESGPIRILTFDDEKGRDVFWHSSAHLMAQAIKRLYPEAQLGIGPPIDDGFYYDIELNKMLTPDDFDDIEAEMQKIVDEDLTVTRMELTKNEAINLFKSKNESS